MNLKKSISSLFFLIVVTMFIGGCVSSDGSPKKVSKHFWEAVQERDMEKAKQFSTWDTVDYLKYLKTEKLHPERFELSDELLGEDRAEITTTLYTSKQGKSGIKVPGVTVLVKIEQGWRIDVKKTLGTVVKHTMNNVFDQLNGLMQEGVSELDKALSESISELGKAIDESAKELRNELNKPLFPNDKTLPDSNSNYRQKI